MSSEQLPAGWIRKESGSRPGTFYYFNTDTGESQWDKPTAARGDEVRCLHLLQKHRGSRRPASWRNDNITCTKEAAIGVLRGASAGARARAASGLAFGGGRRHVRTRSRVTWDRAGLREQIERAGTAGGAAALRAEFERLAQQHSDCSSAKRGAQAGCT